MTETNPGDIIYLTKREKELGAVVKVRVTENDRKWWEDARTSSGYRAERYVRIGQFEATEQAARDKAEDLIAKEIASPAEHRECCAMAFEGWLGPRWEDYWLGEVSRKERDAMLDALPSLRGKNLACWCPLDEPSHADVLLRLANEAAP